MTPRLWLPLDPMAVDRAFNQRHAPAMTLPQSFIWAVWAAEGSDYLKKLDATHPGSGAHVPPTDAHPGLVDIAHVRWATGNALTAIDLCAATMGRLFCGVTRPPELDLRKFDRRVNSARRDPRRRWRRAASTAMRWLRLQPASRPPREADLLRAALPTAFLDWVTDTLNDPLYRELHQARNPFTHAWLQRKLFVGGQAPANRTEFEVLGTGYQMNARKMVEDSAALAIGRVKAFIEVVNQHN
ncbi:MAG: hypothetical protein WBZ37_31125 [Mycobacterium sp.]